MKKIEAIIRTTQFEEIRDALANIGVKFFSLKEVRGYGLQKGSKQIYRGADMGASYIPRLQMDIVTTADKAAQIVDTILASGRTGQIGDGKIFVFDVEQTIRIRNGERDANAI